MLDITTYTYDKYLDGDCGILDSHCHIGLLPEPSLYADAINKFSVMSCTTIPSQYERDIKFAKSNIVVGLGFHPRDVDDSNLDDELSKFTNMLKQHKPKLIGEIGLDFSQSYAKKRDFQIQAFSEICNLISKSENKILSIHAIKSANEVMDIFEESGAANKGNNKIIFHWFSDSCEALTRALNMGAYFSVGPKMLATRRGHEYIRQIPENRMLIETDLPWDNEPLTPTEHYNILNDFLIELRETKGY